MKKLGFTLAETLVALVVMGIVASMTIPIVIKQQKYRENIAGYHRAVNMLNKAFKEYQDGKKEEYYVVTENGKQVIKRTGVVSDPTFFGAGNLTSTDLIIANIVKPYLPLMDKTASVAMSGCSNSAKMFYTADGMRFCIAYAESSSINANYGEKTYGLVWVDVNGDKKPNATPSSTKNPGDTFPIVILKNRFIPGHTSTTDSMVTVSQKIYYGEQ